MTTKKRTQKSKPPVQLVPLDDITGWEDNPRTHDIPAISGSMGRWGYVEFVVRDSTSGKLVAGHGRLQTLTELRESGADPPEDVVVGDDGTWQIWVREKAFENELEARAYVVASNRTHDLGGYDETLSEFVRQFEEDDDLLRALAYEPEDLADILSSVEDTYALETPQMPASGSRVRVGSYTRGTGAPPLAPGSTNIAPPGDEFPEVGEDLPTEHQCPKCGYEWSGASR